MLKSTYQNFNLKIILLSLCLLSCYGNIPTEACGKLDASPDERPVEFRVERNLSQRVFHSWYETLNDSNNWVYHGEESFYYPAGHLKARFYYQLGQKEGEFSLYHPNGALSARGNYSAGKLDGKNLNWSEEGVLLGLKTWKQGKLEGWQEKRDLKGQLIERYFFMNGQKLNQAPQ